MENQLTEQNELKAVSETRPAEAAHETSDVEIEETLSKDPDDEETDELTEEEEDTEENNEAGDVTDELEAE